ncbi:MAG: beta-N-acetylhexosaminidase [Endozoicomonadaceae bacterium]|nr:beta-N-acetylhexosaminidase [Endozoicomonadaceae bacterium]
MTCGLLMTDLEGLVLTKDEQELITTPETGGIILFSRNYKNAAQLKALITHIHSLRDDILIAVDQEGGSVQRLKGEYFTTLPHMCKLGELFKQDQTTALHLAYECGWVTGFELASFMIDINLAPVLDINYHINRMLQTRCFSDNVDHVIQLTSAYLSGLQSTEVRSAGKHFPGHGGVQGDTHISFPHDERPLEQLQTDLQPFRAAIKNHVSAVMPSHVVYSAIDPEAAGFSTHWLNTVLREQLEFKGAVISDCLSMTAASVGGNFAERAEKALTAGVDLLLVCNNSKGVREVVEWLRYQPDYPEKYRRIKKLKRPNNPLSDSESRKAKLQEALKSLIGEC